MRGRPARANAAGPAGCGHGPRSGYRVEKIIFESQPKHYVTALLFLPEAGRFRPPYPGVLVPCGHALPAKGHPEYQSMGALLALNGMAAPVFDPMIRVSGGNSWAREAGLRFDCTAAHINVGMGCILLGQNTATSRPGTACHEIDYLQSRPEVDPQRIGCTGNSGGGTQTSYLMALDERFLTAPSCYLTSLPKMLASIGPQDSEQHLFGQLIFPWITPTSS